MNKRSGKQSTRFDQRFLAFIIIPLAVAVFLITYVGIKESRSDSFELLVIQGQAFIESLAKASENAITSEQFYDQLIHKRYNEITTEIELKELDSLSDRYLYQLALNHNLYAAFVYDMDSNLVVGAIARGSFVQLPNFVDKEVRNLIRNPEDNYLLLLDDDNATGEALHYYIKLSNKLDRVIVLVGDALYYVQALQQTEIGYLARQMAMEKGVSYIVYQTKDSIIFSSRKASEFNTIESDPFLTEALESDTIMHRKYTIEDQEVLELVRPFSTSDSPFGLLRVGLSLDAYNSVLHGYDLQMIILSLSLFLLVLVVMVYINSRRKRIEITAQYQQIKSISDKIFDEMKIGVAAVDKNGMIIFANAAFDRIFDIPEAKGSNWDEVVQSPSLHYGDFYRSSETVLEREINFQSKNASKTLLIGLSKLHKTDDLQNGMVAVVYNITVFRDLEKKSARKERLSEMGNLAAGVAHEIRNPLNTISIASQRLASEFHPSENKDEYLAFTKQIREETKRLNDIITRFLALARGEEQKNQLVDLHDIVNQFVLFINAEADNLDITITTDLQHENMVHADADQIKQVLSNLFNNSKEAIADKRGEIKISSSRQDDKVTLTFEDNGPGIPEEIREQIFTPYYTTKEAGTGLGLPTVHRIVTDMGGEISIEKSDLGGAKFVISFDF